MKRALVIGLVVVAGAACADTDEYDRRIERLAAQERTLRNQDEYLPIFKREMARLLARQRQASTAFDTDAFRGRLEAADVPLTIKSGTPSGRPDVVRVPRAQATRALMLLATGAVEAAVVGVAYDDDVLTVFTRHLMRPTQRTAPLGQRALAPPWPWARSRAADLEQRTQRVNDLKAQWRANGVDLDALDLVKLNLLNELAELDRGQREAGDPEHVTVALFALAVLLAEPPVIRSAQLDVKAMRLALAADDVAAVRARLSPIAPVEEAPALAIVLDGPSMGHELARKLEPADAAGRVVAAVAVARSWRCGHAGAEATERDAGHDTALTARTASLADNYVAGALLERYRCEQVLPLPEPFVQWRDAR